MSSFVGTITILALSLPVAAAADPATPAQQYAAVLKEYQPVSVGLRDATTDLERKAAVERLAAFSLKFITLAQKYPSDPVALKALRQAVQVVVSTDSAALNA